MEDFKPIVVKDPLMTISANAEGIQFEPSALLKQMFGETLVTPVYYKRVTRKKENAASGEASGKPPTPRKRTNSKEAKE